MTELEKLKAGMTYVIASPDVVAAHIRAVDLCDEYNATRRTELARREQILRELFGSLGTNPLVEKNIRVDYGFNLHAGDNFFVNYDCVFLDCAPITFGNNVFIAPQCGFYAVNHPLGAAERNSGVERGQPITVGADVWFGREDRLQRGRRRRERGRERYPLRQPCRGQSRARGKEAPARVGRFWRARSAGLHNCSIWQQTPARPRFRGHFFTFGTPKKFSPFPKKSCFRHAKQLDGIFRKAYNDEVIGRKGEFPRPLPRFAERPKTVPKQSEGYCNQGVGDL